MREHTKTVMDLRLLLEDYGNFLIYMNKNMSRRESVSYLSNEMTKITLINILKLMGLNLNEKSLEKLGL